MFLRGIDIKNAKPGDVLGRDVDDLSTGNILVAKGTPITESLIRHIKNAGIKRVFIEDKVLEKRVNPVVAENYQKIENKIMTVFDQVASGDENFNLGGTEDAFLELAKGISDETDIIGQLLLLRSNDDYTYLHSMGVGILAAKLGTWLGLSEKERYQLSVAGIYHDIGKMKIPHEIINKKGPLTDEEFEIVKQHSKFSYEIIKNHSDFDEEIALAVLMHHEKMDGSGYPLGLSGDRITKFARILGVCDIYNALTSNRVYRMKDSPFIAAGYLRQDSFTKLDPYFVRTFVDSIAPFYIGNRVYLSDGREGIIVALDPVQKNSPLVQVGDEFIDLKLENEIKIVDVVG